MIGNTDDMTINGWTYKKGSVVVLKFSHETRSGIPEFAKVTRLFLQQEKRFALVSVLEADENRHLRAYAIKTRCPEQLQVVELKDIMENEPLWPVKTFDNTGIEYVCARNFL